MYLCDESDSCGCYFKGWRYEDKTWNGAEESAEASESYKTAELSNREAWTVCGRRVMSAYDKSVQRYSI